MATNGEIAVRASRYAKIESGVNRNSRIPKRADVVLIRTTTGLIREWWCFVATIKTLVTNGKRITMSRMLITDLFNLLRIPVQDTDGF